MRRLSKIISRTFRANKMGAIIIALLSVFLLNTNSIAKDRLTLSFFGSSTCGECLEIKERLLKPMMKEQKNLEVDFYDIDSDSGFKLLSLMEHAYHLTTSSPQELFFPDTVLLGYDQIIANAKPMILRYLSDPDKWESRIKIKNGMVDTSYASALRDKISMFTFIGLFAAGFADGINPCAISTMIFLISFLAVQKRRRREALTIGLLFTGTVFITYFLMGLGTFKLLTSFSQYYWLSLIIRVTAVTVATIVGLVSIWDAIKFKRSRKTGDISMQLPKIVKLAIHRVIEGNITKKKIVIGTIVSAFIITVLQAICTVKIYMPTIVLMTKHYGFRLKGWLLLIFYNLLFVTPLLIVLILATFGLKWDKLAKFTQKHLSTIEIFIGVVLLLLAVFLSFG
jgi:cytochrome c biogenesis protein CcdA